jgi:ribosomal protein S18 acetylase RimI-like enzyme
MNTNMTIQPATMNDLEVLAFMFDDYRQCYEQTPDYTAAKNFIQDRLSLNDTLLLIAYDEIEGQKIGAGFVQIYPSFSSISMKKIFILNDLYVNPDLRKKGIAKLLINSAKQFAIDSKAGQLVIETRISNSSAQKLYDSVGFTKEGEHLYYYLET